MQRKHHLVLTALTCVLLAAGLAWANQQRSQQQAPDGLATPGAGVGVGAQTIVIHITSGPDDLFAIMTGLHMAEDARALGRRTIIMFSKAGVRVPMAGAGWELRMGDQPPVKDILFDLQGRGVEILICDFSAMTLGIYDREFIDGAFIVNTNEVLLRRMGSNAAVFTY